MNQTDQKSPKSSPHILGGAMIIAGTAIGGGMLSLPIISAGMWFGWSILILIFCCFCAYSSAMYLAEANMNYKTGVNYATMAKDTLGKLGSVGSFISVGFVSYILCYAYVSGGSSVLSSTFNSAFNIQLPTWQYSVIFGAVLGLIVMLGSRTVDRVSTIMIVAMVISFVWSIVELSSNIKVNYLFPATPMSDFLPYIWVGIPVLAISFGFHSTVPSIVKHYNKDIKKSQRAILYGSLLTLTIYIIWQLAILGSVDRGDFNALVSQGGNVNTLIQSVSGSTASSLVDGLLSFFAKFALASSFLGVALGLLDFIKDLFNLNETKAQHWAAGAITFIPVIVLGAAIPNGFIVAIGYASLLASIFVFILPCSIALVCRQRGKSKTYRLAGGQARLYFVLLFGVLVFICEALALLGLLPTFL
ncbi:aromatic amino acid transporter [Vibrio sp. SS-MA-C1-2]|uniref:amino acid permease n=1 Tax=Vibrio sp. SS-MA-C1-2 TaxID=2908646 RepID=UPI001F225ABA|nr:aromatic amino acid transport family protein [Vibrio sp. SS-MA-C1-2]UJF18169.1 aromatic amino acid transporter [Vibrio sp. SS-MA-C1-2]